MLSATESDPLTASTCQIWNMRYTRVHLPNVNHRGENEIIDFLYQNNLLNKPN